MQSPMRDYVLHFPDGETREYPYHGEIKVSEPVFGYTVEAVVYEGDGKPHVYLADSPHDASP